MMTPSQIEVLIHCHVSPTPHPRANAPAVRDAYIWFENDGLIEKVDGKFYTTDRGKAHIAQLCDLPLPQMVWMGADGKVRQVVNGRMQTIGS